jgi:hypothetical protein
MKNHSLLIVKLMVALMLIIAMNSCATNTNGLVNHGCRGMKAHPNYKHR